MVSIGKEPDLSFRSFELSVFFKGKVTRDKQTRSVYIGTWNKTRGKVMTHLEIDRKLL